MIALAARIALLFELVCYLAIGTWLVLGRQYSLSHAVLFACAIPVALRMMFSLPSYIVATWLRLQARTPVNISDTVVALVKDTWAKVLSYTVLLPFEKWLMSPDALPVPGGAMPTLLVHGYVNNRGVFRKMRRMLAKRVSNPIFTLTFEPPFTSIDTYVPQLAARVEEICTAAKSEQILIVAHSMGGLAARAYIARGGGKHVARLITIGTPHHGTAIAFFGIGDNARQMHRDSQWLAQLAEEERAHPANVPLTSIYTENDDIVCPSESCIMPQADNIALTAVGHVSLLFSEKVADIVAVEIGQLA
jgi:triacylglycerol lipase